MGLRSPDAFSLGIGFTTAMTYLLLCLACCMVTQPGPIFRLGPPGVPSDAIGIDLPPFEHQRCVPVSISTCSNQKRMSISRYIAVAVAKCSCASCRFAEAEVTVGDERAHA